MELVDAGTWTDCRGYLEREKARKASEQFLWDSKVSMRHSVYMVEEYIENEDDDLTISKCTTVALGKGGHNFFRGHVEDKDRYKALSTTVKFTDTIINKCRSID